MSDKICPIMSANALKEDIECGSDCGRYDKEKKQCIDITNGKANEAIAKSLKILTTKVGAK